MKKSDTPGSSAGLDEMRVMIYDAEWRVLEERVDVNWSSGFTADKIFQTIYGIRYLDDVVCRRLDYDADGDYTDTGSKTYYHLTDNHFSTVAIVDENANLIERISYDPYGRARHHRIGDMDGDGDADGNDDMILQDPIEIGGGSVAITSGSYVVDGDINRDGAVDGDDVGMFSMESGLASGALSASAVGNVFGYSGYVYNEELSGGGTYTVRFRHYDIALGRWLERDPLEYADSMNMHEYVGGMPLLALDPLGLEGAEWHHIIPQRYFDAEKGGPLSRFNSLRDAKWNGFILPNNVHNLTRRRWYAEYVEELLNAYDDWDTIDSKTPEKRLKKIAKKIKKRFQWRVFRFGYKADIPFRRTAAETAEATSRLKKLGFLGLLVLGGLVVTDANAQNQELLTLFQQFERAIQKGDYTEANLIAQQIAEKVDYFGSEINQILMHELLMQEFDERQRQRERQRAGLPDEYCD